MAAISRIATVTPHSNGRIIPLITTHEPSSRPSRLLDFSTLRLLVA